MKTQMFEQQNKHNKCKPKAKQLPGLIFEVKTQHGCLIWHYSNAKSQ